MTAWEIHERITADIEKHSPSAEPGEISFPAGHRSGIPEGSYVKRDGMWVEK